MINRLYKLNDWLPLVKDLVAHLESYIGAAQTVLNVSQEQSHIKLEVISTGVLLHFSDIFSQDGKAK